MKRIAILFIYLIPIILIGQKKSIPVSISIFNESTAIPFTVLISKPLHAGLQMGTEFNYTSKAYSRLFQTANVSYFYHNYLTQGAAINTEIGYEIHSSMGLSVEGLFGLGYMHTFTVADEFTFSDGVYTKKKDKGNSRLYPSLTLGLGYYLKKSDKNSPKIFVRYQSWVEYPYSPGFIPAMTHVNLHLGTKFFLNKN